MPQVESALTRRLSLMKTYEPFYGRAFWNMMATQDITDDFIEDLAVKLATWQNISIFVLGNPGSGKSILGMAMGRIINVLVEDVLGVDRPYSVAGNVRSDMVNFLELIEKAKDFDVFCEDEILKLMGTGSDTAINQLKNLMKAVARHKQLSTVLVGNEFLTMRLYDYVLLTRDRYVNDEDWRKTDWVSCEVWAKIWENLQGQFFPIGRITIPTAILGEDWMEEYEKQEKVGKVERTQREVGFAEADALTANFARLHGKRLSYSQEGEPCPSCGKPTRGYPEGRVVHWVCWSCGARLPDSVADDDS